MKNERRKKHVSFAYTLVTASWPSSSGSTTTKTSSAGNNYTSILRKHACFRNVCADPSALDPYRSVYQSVDPLSLELELPLVAQYRIVDYLSQQFRHRRPFYSSPFSSSPARLPPRPPGVVSPAVDDERRPLGDISSTSLRTAGGVSLHGLRTLHESALVMHPYSRRLDPVTRPILAFLHRTCTSLLSRRQNYLVGLLPKLMEIIILLCESLEFGAQMFLKKEENVDAFLNNSCSGDESSSSLMSLSSSLRIDTRLAKATGFSHRCAWWLSRLHNRTAHRLHRLFVDVKKLLLDPGPMCDVKAMYLQYIAHRFFPQSPFIQRDRIAISIDGNNEKINNEPFDEHSHTENELETMRMPSEPIDYSDTPSMKKHWFFHNG